MKKCFLIFSIFILSCGNDDPSHPSFDGIVALNTNLSASEPFSNYTTEYQAVYNAGARGAQTAAPWASLNPTGSTFDLTPITNPYFGLNALKDLGFEAIFLNVPIVAIDKRSMPADMMKLTFDDATVKTRFHALLDNVIDQLNDKVKYMAFGNEVDTYFANHPTEWSAYISLIEDAKEYLKLKRPDIQVAVTSTFQGASITAATEVSLLNANMDVIALTYYPVSSGFITRAPATVKDDVSKMITLANGKPIVVQEWGYPSSTFLGSSEQNQADFISDSMEELAGKGKTFFPFVSFFKYRDWNDAYVQTITGQISGQNFYEFMSSLGLKNNDGSDKAAFKIIEAELKK